MGAIVFDSFSWLELPHISSFLSTNIHPECPVTCCCDCYSKKSGAELQTNLQGFLLGLLSYYDTSATPDRIEDQCPLWLLPNHSCRSFLALAFVWQISARCLLAAWRGGAIAVGQSSSTLSIGELAFQVILTYTSIPIHLGGTGLGWPCTHKVRSNHLSMHLDMHVGEDTISLLAGLGVRIQNSIPLVRF